METVVIIALIAACAAITVAILAVSSMNTLRSELDLAREQLITLNKSLKENIDRFKALKNKVEEIIGKQ